jgi:hypothetical protein
MTSQAAIARKAWRKQNLLPDCAGLIGAIPAIRPLNRRYLNLILNYNIGRRLLGQLVQIKLWRTAGNRTYSASAAGTMAHKAGFAAIDGLSSHCPFPLADEAGTANN